MTNIEVRDKLYSIVTSKEEVLDRSFFTLLPVGYKNRKGNMVAKHIAEGLELEYKIDISDVMAEANLVIFDDILRLSNVSRDDLMDAATYNTEKAYPPKFEAIGDVLNMEGFSDLPMYVLTNDKMVYGAGAILYDGMYEKLERIVGDFIVLPSSVHETIIVPSVFDCPYITSMIRQVNETVVAPDEVLSNRPYKLTPAGDLIEI